MIGDLTTLANVKSWLGVPTPSPDDALLARLISAQSRYIQSWLCRDIASKSYTENRDGLGAGRGKWVMMFKDSPVTSVASLFVNDVQVQPSPDNGVLQAGFGFDTNKIWIADTGYAFERVDMMSQEFRRGVCNVKLNYTAGFLVLPFNSPLLGQDRDLLPPEVQVIPTMSPYTITPFFTWVGDNGVWYTSTGLPLTAVAGVPAVGQYNVAGGVYTFNAADAGNAVSLSYSYIPPSIEQACIELISLRYKEKDRIGQVSKHVGTETVSFMMKAMPDDVASILNQYRKTFSFA